jgi:hypothetical protein
VKTTRPAWRRTKLRVVVRRFRDPAVPIQLRDEWKWSARGPLSDGAALDPVPELADPEDVPEGEPAEDGEDEPVGDEPDTPEVREETVAAGPEPAPPFGAGLETADVTVDTACVTTGGGFGTGRGEVVVGGGGSGSVGGGGTVTVGAGGRGGSGGIRSAAAVPASSAAPSIAMTQRNSRIRE